VRRSVVPHRLLHEGRGLCPTCYKRERLAGRLLDWPRLTWSTAELVADAELLRARGVRPWSAVAVQLGVRPATLERARCRVSAQRRVA
jgi:hypothetical protein